MNTFSNGELPVGFGMALAQNSTAMETFAMLSEEQKNAILDKAHSANSKQEMNELVEKIANAQL